MSGLTPQAEFARICPSYGGICSMSRSGNVWDSVVMGGFFSSLKTERARKMHRTRDETRVDVIDYIESFYGP